MLFSIAIFGAFALNTTAGICHSDIHTAKNEWGPAKYPLVPGHEIVGIVTQVGAKVTKFKVRTQLWVAPSLHAGVC